MPHYLWKGVNVHGYPEEGAIESPNTGKILDELRKKNIFKVHFHRIFNRRLQLPLNQDITVHFLTQLYRLLDSGIELVDSLSFIIRYQANTLFGYILCALRQDIQEGKSLSDAFLRFQANFPPIFLHLIAVAEKSGNLKGVVEELLIFFAFQNRFAQERRKLLTYPLIVSGIVVILFLGILFFVIPNFKSMFAALGDDLPLTTRGLLILSDSLRTTPQYWVAGGAVGIAGFGYYWRIADWGRILFFVPGLHGIEQSIRLLFYARSMMIMLKSGMQLREALAISESLFSKRLREEIRGVHQQIDSGKSLVDAYSSSSLFPPLFVHLVAVGESSGHLVPTFDRIAALYQEMLEKRMNLLNSLIEPIFTVVLGLGILIILLSIYLPIFEMAGRF